MAWPICEKCTRGEILVTPAASKLRPPRYTGGRRGPIRFQELTALRSPRAKPASAAFLESCRGYLAVWLVRVLHVRYYFIVRNGRHEARLGVRLFDDFVTAMIQQLDQPVSHGKVPCRK
jgi:hypothetical protein